MTWVGEEKIIYKVTNKNHVKEKLDFLTPSLKKYFHILTSSIFDTYTLLINTSEETQVFNNSVIKREFLDVGNKGKRLTIITPL